MITLSIVASITNSISPSTEWPKRNRVEVLCLAHDFDVSKCKHVHFSNPTFNNAFLSKHFLNNNALDTVSSYKYVNVHLTSDLSCNNHIGHMLSKGNRSLGFLKRVFHNAPSTLKRLSYVTLICPTLEYACGIWIPQFQYSLTVLDAFQNCAVRVMFSDSLVTQV